MSLERLERQLRGREALDAAALGMVYYFHAPDFQTIRGEKPHVGFLDSHTRLVWLTDHEIFVEEAFPATNPTESTYVITALYHDLLGTPPTVRPRGTQAIYTRCPDHRPDFFNFDWQMSNKQDSPPNPTKLIGQ